MPCFDQSEESVLHDASATYEETECDIESFTILSDSDEDQCLSLDNEQENNTANNGWIQVADLDSDQPPSLVQFPPTSLPGTVGCIDRDSAAHEYVIHLLGNYFIDVLVRETNFHGDNKVLIKINNSRGSRFK